MGRIEDIFASARAEGRKLLMPFVCAEHPRAGATVEVLPALDRAGAAIVEVGIPFSDPIADGPVIAGAMHEALERGATPGRVFEQVASVRSRVDCGLVAMVSVSIVHRFGGASGFVGRAKEAGFDGLIIPDLPVEDAGGVLDAARSSDMTLSMLIAPATSRDRAQRLCEASSGFVYLLARSGITGERRESPEIGGRVAQLREITDLPIAAGFGISTAEHVAAAVSHADAAIVGSALVKRLTSAVDPAAEADAFVRELSSGLPGGGQTQQQQD
ncbi:MAG: tryptophan synthase subunit alpha [Phycisphaerales bacterium JB037]